MNKQRVAMVTGAGQGIGKAIASRLLQDGYTVIIAEKDREAGRKAKKDLLSFGGVDFNTFYQKSLSDRKSTA